jgi:hypothetical protein
MKSYGHPTGTEAVKKFNSEANSKSNIELNINEKLNQTTNNKLME